MAARSRLDAGSDRSQNNGPEPPDTHSQKDLGEQRSFQT